MTTVHDFSEEIPEVGLGHFAIALLDVVHEHLATDSEVTVVEAILAGPTQ